MTVALGLVQGTRPSGRSRAHLLEKQAVLGLDGSRLGVWVSLGQEVLYRSTNKAISASHWRARMSMRILD